MKMCPNCSKAIAILRIARSKDAFFCPCCGTELRADRRSRVLMYASLTAFVPLAWFLVLRLTGHSFVFGLCIGTGVGLCAGAAGCLIYALTVRFRPHHPGDARPFTAGRRNWGGLI